MDRRLETIIESLLQNIETLNKEIQRLSRTEQFTPTAQCFQMIEHIRDGCLSSLQNLRTMERMLCIRKLTPLDEPTQADILRLQQDNR